MLRPPAGIEDFERHVTDREQAYLRERFLELWNDPEGGFLGSYAEARADLPNYVDPRVEPPTSGPVPVPWNGFPKLLSRWFSDETDPERREDAEAVADTPVPLVHWVQPDPRRPDKLREFSCATHQVPYFAKRLGKHVTALARPRRFLQENGSLGDEIPTVHRQQDEYLEWHAERDAGGKLVALTFTAEPPDYWMALAAVCKRTVVELYSKLLDADVPERDLFFEHDVVAAGLGTDGTPGWIKVAERGDYNPLNAWTTTKGAIHLTHPANTLGAEVNLAKDASQAFACDGLAEPTPDEPAAEVRRIVCGGYGGINRSSDPLIGLQVGDLIGRGRRVTLTDPVGLYIARCDLSSLLGPGGVPLVEEAMSIVRGEDHASEPRILRLRIAVPDERNFVLGDCTFDGRPLSRGGQIARLTTMALYAQPYPDGANRAERACEGIPCRHPDHPELFAASERLDGEDACPARDDPAWLLQSPFVGPPPPTGPAATAGLVPQAEELPVATEAGPVLPRRPSRAPIEL